MAESTLDSQSSDDAEIERQAAPKTDSGSSIVWVLAQPILVLGSMALVASAIALEWMDPDLLTSIMLFAPLPLILIAERIWTKRQDWLLTPGEMAEDTFWLGFAALIWVPLYDDYYETPISRAFEALREASPVPITLQPDGFFGLIFCALAAMMISSFIYYWLHRVQHETLFFWRMHATHHHITKMGAMRGDRTHPLEYLALVLGAPIAFALLGASNDVIAVAAAFGFFNGYLNHSNLPLRSAPVYDWLFATAQQHHLHHSHHFDSSNTNYGCNLIIWDRIFGTYSAATEVERIGAGTGQPLSILTQLKLAFISNAELKKL